MRNFIVRFALYLIDVFGSEKGPTYTTKPGRLLKSEQPKNKAKDRAVEAFMNYKPMTKDEYAREHATWIAEAIRARKEDRYPKIR